MSYLDRLAIVAKGKAPVLLSEAISEWVDYWNPNPLLKLYKTQPDLFKSLPKSNATKFYRLIYLSRKQVYFLLGGGLLKPKNPLESWSTNKDLDKVGEGQASHGKKPGMYAVILRKSIPFSQQVLSVADAAQRRLFISLKLSNDFIAREAEVIVTGQIVEAKHIVSIKDPLLNEKIRPKDFLARVPMKNSWDAKKKLAKKLIDKLWASGEMPRYNETLGDGFVLEFYSSTSYGIRQTDTNIRQIWNPEKKLWQMS